MRGGRSGTFTSRSYRRRSVTEGDLPPKFHAAAVRVRLGCWNTSSQIQATIEKWSLCPKTRPEWSIHKPLLPENRLEMIDFGSKKCLPSRVNHNQSLAPGDRGADFDGDFTVSAVLGSVGNADLKCECVIGMTAPSREILTHKAAWDGHQKMWGLLDIHVMNQSLASAPAATAEPTK